MEVKILEVRDYMTFIPVIAIKMESSNEEQRYLMARCGYWEHDSRCILLVKIWTQEAHTDPYAWLDARTMRISHEFITNYFDGMKDGDVVDVQFILGETNEKKKSERETIPI
jgi:hypothetical protein